MKLLLRGKGLSNILNGTEKPPSQGGAAAVSVYMQRKDVALTDIILSIEENCSHAVINLEDLQTAWKTLEDMYKGVSDACEDRYLEMLHSFQMMEEEKVVAYFKRLVALEDQLGSVGHSFSEKDKIRAPLRGLSSDFEVTTKVIRAMDFTFTKAVFELVIEEES